MKNNFVIYQKFPDIHSASEFAAELRENDIEYQLEDNNQAYVKVVGYQSIDLAIGLSIKESDFSRADKILDTYYNKQMDVIDSSYYLFDYSNEELQDILSNPFDWGKLDYQLCKHILKQRGVNINDTDLENIKENKIKAMSQKEKARPMKIIAGYILACSFPVLAIIIAISIKYNRKILPTGATFYINTDGDRKHAQRILLLCILWFILFFISLFYAKS
jgi:hypothetical protein